MKRTTKSTDGTSWFNSTVTATVDQLIQVLGDPVYAENDGEDKVNFEWNGETDGGAVFTVYDWKEYRRIAMDEEIEWHIGGHRGIDTRIAANEIEEALNKLK